MHESGVVASCTLTSDNTGKVYENVTRYSAPAFISEDEAIMAYQTKQLSLQDEIYVRRTYHQFAVLSTVHTARCSFVLD